MAVLATSPVLLAFLTVLLVLMGSIVAISAPIAYCETLFYRDLACKALFSGLGLGLSEGFGALTHEIWAFVDEPTINLY